MTYPHLGEFLAALVSFGIIYSVIRAFKKSYKNRDKNETKKPRIVSDKEWIGETDKDFSPPTNTELDNESSIKIPTRIKKRVRKRDKGACVTCGSTKKLEYEHILPLSDGGINSVGNIQLICKNCKRKN